MASVKLTKDMRKSILDKVIERRFSETEKALLDEAVALCTEFVSGLEIKGEWPEGWFRKMGKFHIKVAGITGKLGEKYEHGASLPFLRKESWCWEVRLKKAIQVAFRYSDGYPEIGRNHELWPVFEYLRGRIDTFFEERDEARSKTAAILARFSTVKSLLDTWPEMEPFVPTVAAALPPALPIYEMNKMLGLPVDEEPGS